MKLLEKVKRKLPHGMPNAKLLLRDQFVEYMSDGALQCELKQLVRRQPTATLLDIRSETICWEWEGTLGGTRALSQSVSSAYGIQYGVQGHQQTGAEFSELREMLRNQQ